MASDARWVNDPDQLDQILQKVYTRLPIILREGDQTFPTQVERTGPGQMLLKHSAPVAATRILVAKLQSELILLECAVVSRLPDRREYCTAKRLQLHRTLRKEERVELNQSKVSAIGLVPTRQFPEFMSAGQAKRDAYIAGVERELSNLFGAVSVILRKTIRMDLRMRAMQQSCRAILNSPSDAVSPVLDSRFVPLKEYNQIISYDKLPKGVISEISVGLFYRRNYLYGYIRALSESAFTFTQFDRLNGVARRVESFFEENVLLPSNPDKCPVLDLSMSGAGILHPQSPIVMQKFMPGEQLVMDMQFPSGTINFFGSIRNIKSLENAHRIGIEFEQIDTPRRVALEQALGIASGSSADVSEV